MKKFFIFLIILTLAACTNAPEEKLPAETPPATGEPLATREEETPAVKPVAEEPAAEEAVEEEPTPQGEDRVIAYRGALKGMGELGGIEHVGEGNFIDPAAMGLFTFTYTYDENGDVFVYYPKRAGTRLEIYTLVYDAAKGNLVAKEFPMFEHTMKQDEVFVLLYAYRDEPKIEIVFHNGDESATWRPMDMEHMNLPEEIGELTP